MIGCGPYNPSQVQWLEDSVALENYHAQGEFLVHLGDVLAGGSQATVEYHERVAGILKGCAVPAFIVPGDNEWTEQKDPQNAWQLWTDSFMKLHGHWNEDGRLAKLCPASEGVRHQAEREENFAFVRKGVLLIGINLPGGRPHDAQEWARRLPANARWIAQNFERYGDQVRAAVIFAQTHPFGAFSEPLRAASEAFGKPVLYLHADFHQWNVSRPWPEQNFLKVQTDQLGTRPPLLVTVRKHGPELFQFDRQRRLLRGPYLALGTPRSMCVVWRTRGQTEPVVRYGHSPRKLDRAASADDILVRMKDDADPSRTLHSSPDAVRQHEATIRSLEPSTTYYYGVFDGDTLLAGADDAHHFTTPPEPGVEAPLRFWVVGDSGTGGEAQARVYQAMRTFTAGRRQRPIDLFLHVGDMAYNAGKDHEFQNHFFKPYHRSLRNTVCWPAMGNHEGGTSSGKTGIGPYYDCYVLPTRGEAGGAPSGTEAYYSFDHGNVHFIVKGTSPIMRRVIFPEHGSVIVDVEGHTATAVMINSKGEQRDRFRIVKRG